MQWVVSENLGIILAFKLFLVILRGIQDLEHSYDISHGLKILHMIKNLEEHSTL